jgi:hypothetical protein
MNIFDTMVLNGVVANLIAPQSALLDRYFPTVSVSDKETVSVDVIKGARRIAPFVSPYVEGKIVQSRGYITKTFAPAYVKPKFRYTPDRAFKRAAGEAIGGTLSPQERMQRVLVADLEEGLQMITRREEVMASEAIRTGHIIVVGDNYPSQDVDFQRDASLLGLTPTAAWDSTSTPLDDLNDISLSVLRVVGAKANDVIMGIDAWKAFSSNAKVEKRLLQLNIVGTSLVPKPIMDEGLTYMGTIDGFNLFIYAGWYVDPQDNTTKEIWPGPTVALMSGALQGVRLFGAIYDHDGLVAQRVFTKSWLEDDPSIRFLMLQSAPLPVTERPDAAAAFDVVS